MTILMQICPGLLAVALAASLAACGKDAAGPAQADAKPQPEVVANDCRTPDAQTSQRGCRPLTKTMGSL